jgi:hypothetical protein
MKDSQINIVVKIFKKELEVGTMPVVSLLVEAVPNYSRLDLIRGKKTGNTGGMR